METAGKTFDLGRALYDQYSALALGWVCAFALAIYVVFLTNRINSIWKSHVSFANKVVEDIKPHMDNTALAMASAANALNELRRCVGAMSNQQILMLGRMGINEHELSLLEDRTKDGGVSGST